MMPIEMYDLDSTDRRIVAALQVDGRASWTDIAQLTGTSVTTVARRAQQLLADELVKVAAVPQPGGGGPGDLLIVRIRCSPGSQLPAAQALAAMPEVRFVALVTGVYDLVAEVLVPKGTSMHSVLLSGLQAIDGVQGSVADLELHTYKASHEWSQHLLGDAGQLAGPPPVHNCSANHLDEVDERIVAALQADGRASFQAVAGGLGVSESTVRRRFEALHQAGCVQVITLVPAAALGFEAEILFWLSVAPARLDGVARELAALRGVRYVAATLGQESLMCEVILPTHADVFEFTTKTLAGIDGIQAWTAGVQLLTVKRGFVVTPWAARRLGTAPEQRPAAPAPRAPRAPRARRG
ncbi:Lrp/AsnC family transcriptional regulator [Micromonospora sp. HM134]|nr:Lrp/AsnC family transcriptional regulator [Micromonospora sp. HM134]